MAGQADGSIIIDTELDSKGFKAGSAELLSAIKSLTGKVEKLQKQMQKVGEQKIASDEYKQVQQDIAQAEKYLAQYNQRLNKLSEKGKINTTEWDSLTADIRAANAELSRLRTLKTAMEQNGTAYISGTQTEQYQSLNAALVSSKQRLAEMEAELARVNSQWARMPTLTGFVRSAIQSIGSITKSSFGTIGTAFLHPLQAVDRLFGTILQKAGQLARAMGKSGIDGLVAGLKSAFSHMKKLVTHSNLMKRPLESMSFMLRRIAPSLLMTEGLFGLLRKAVNAFLQENQHLASQLNSCWAGIGNILGPIITRLITLVSTAVAYVTQFLNLLGFVGKSTTKAISNAGGAASKESDKLKRQLASFDELNILSDSSSDSGGDSSTTGAEAQDVTLPDWVKTMVEHLKSGNWSAAAVVLTDQLNNMVASVDWAGVGRNIAYWTDGALEFLATAILTFDWYNLGASLGKMINSVIHGVDWANLGIVLGWKFIALIEGLGGLFSTIDWVGLGKALGDAFMGLWNSIDWAQAARTLSTGIKGVLNGLTAAIKAVDWQKLGNDIATFVANIDYSGIFTALCEGIGAALGGLASVLWGWIEEAWNSAVEWWQEVAYEDGEFTVEGLLSGLWNGICNIGKWVYDNIVSPFIEGFKSAFGIASPSTVMQEQGGFVIEGLLLGLQNSWSTLDSWISEAFTGLSTTITEWASKATQNISTWANDAKQSIGNWAKNAKNDIGDWASDTKSDIASWVTTTKSRVSKWTSEVRSDVSSWATNTKSTLSTWVSNTKSNISNWASNSKSTITSWISSTKSSISSWASNVYSTINSKTNAIKSVISSGFKAAKNSMVNNMQSAMNTIRNQNWYSVGSGICSGIASGINAGWSWLRNLVSNLASSLLASAKSALGINSPSRLFHDIVGLNIGYGIGTGIEDSEGAVLDSVVGVADAIAKEFNNGEYQISGIAATSEIDGAITSFADRITGGFADMLERMQAIAESVNFTVPAAAGGIVPYKTTAAVNGAAGDGVGDVIKASNDELGSVFIQALNNITATIVRAIEENNTIVNVDKDSMTDAIIKEINRRTRATGTSPLIG